MKTKNNMPEITENESIQDRLNDDGPAYEKTREQKASEAFEEAKKQVQQEKKKPVENPAHIPGLPTLEEMRETLSKIAMEEKTMPKPEIRATNIAGEFEEENKEGMEANKKTAENYMKSLTETPANHTLEQVIAIGKAKMEETAASKPVAKSISRTAKPKASTASIVELYKEKINLIEYLESIAVPDSGIEALSKAGRELLMGFQKAIENIKSKAIEDVQNL